MFDSDQKLLRKLKSGDADAYAHAGDRFYREIWAYLYRLTRDYDLAEDLAQETAIRFWQSAPEFREIPSLKAWVYRVAYNLFVSHRRANRMEYAELSETIPATSPACDPEASMDRLVLCQQIETALSKLPEDQRMAVILTKVQGLKLREAAEVLEIPMGTLKWQVHEGLKKLREMLPKESADYVFNHV